MLLERARTDVACSLIIYYLFPGNHGNYFTHLKQVLTFTVENKDLPILSLSFEDMKKVSACISLHNPIHD